jgi:hypothetical protein
LDLDYVEKMSKQSSSSDPEEVFEDSESSKEISSD